MKRAFVLFAACAALVSTMTLADDQHHTGAGDPPRGGRMMMMHMPMMALHGRTEGWLAFLHAELAISDAQGAAWTGFADAVRRAAAAKAPAQGTGMMDMMGGDDKPWPERSEAHLKAMEAHVATGRALQAAAKPLYDALSAEQKKKADALLPAVLIHVIHGPMMMGHGG